MKAHVVIIGQMGVGKSTTGRALAEVLALPYSDSDREIELITGITGGEIAVSDGVPALHRLEAAVLIGAMARSEPHVVTAAASVVEDEMARRVLHQRAFVVHLDAPLPLILQRQAAGEHRRPMTLEELTALADRRAPLIAQVADMTADATVDPASIVQIVRDALPDNLVR